MRSPANGAATVSIPTASLPVGPHAFGVAYAGDSVHAQSSSTVMISVVKRTSRTTLKLSPATVQAGSTAHAVVAVSAAGGTPTGTVEIHRDGKRIAHAKVGRAGNARIKLPAALAAGRHRLTAVYRGDGSDHGSESKAKAFVVKPARAHKR